MSFSLALQTTQACLINSMRIIIGLVYLAAIIITAAVFFASSSETASKTLLFTFGFSVFFWWAFAGSRLLKILRDADKFLIPSPIKAIASAALLQFFFTVVIPASIFALLGNNFIYGLVCLIAVMAGGSLTMLLPRYLGMGMFFAPTLFNKLIDYQWLPAPGSSEFFIFICVFAAVMLVLALWRFYRLRHFEGDVDGWSWTVPMALMPDGANGWGVQSWSRSDSGHAKFDGIRFDPFIQSNPLASPGLALRTYLGGPFMPLTHRSQFKHWAVHNFAYPLFFLSMAVSMSGDKPRDVSITAALAAFFICLLALGITFSAALVRLRTLYAKDNAELAELALTPGWSDGCSARRLLQNVILQYVGRTLLLPIIIAYVALTFITTEGHDAYLIISGLITVCFLIGTGYVMNMISGKISGAWLIAVFIIAVFSISLMQLLFSVKSHDYSSLWLSWPSWLAFLTVAVAYFLFSLRPFLNRPHPFLRN
jgi:hypothetical protein